MAREGFILLIYADWRGYPDYEPFTDGGIWLSEDAIKAEVEKRNAEELKDALWKINRSRNTQYKTQLQAFHEREALVAAGLRTQRLTKPEPPEPVTVPGKFFKPGWSYEGGIEVHE